MDTDLPLVQCRHHHHLQSKATPPAVLFLCSSLNGRRSHGIMLIHENVCFIPFIEIDNPVKMQEKLQLVLTEALIVTYAARWSHDKLIWRVVQTDVQILWFHAVDATLLQVNVNRAKVKRLEEKGFFFPPCESLGKRHCRRLRSITTRYSILHSSWFQAAPWGFVLLLCENTLPLNGKLPWLHLISPVFSSGKKTLKRQTFHIVREACSTVSTVAL